MDQLALILAAVGIALVVAEIFIPSGGMITVAAIASFAGSVWFAWKAWWPDHAVYWWSYLAGVLILLPTVIVGAFYLFPRTKMGRKILLEAPNLSEVTPYVEEERRLSKTVGQIGRTLSPLTPGGLVQVGGERFHCFSEGMIVDQGTPVKVVAVRGNRLLVQVVSVHADSKDTAPPERVPDAREEPPLDFDMSQG